MSLRKKVIINAGSNWAGQLIAALVGLVLIPVIRGKLGEESFGIWFLLSTGLRYPMILESSFSLTTNRFVAFYRNDAEQLNRFVSASFAILIALAALTIAAAVILSYFICDIFSAISAGFAFDAKVTCILVGVTLSFRIVEASFSGTLMGWQYHTRTNTIVCVINILRGLLTIGVLVFWKSIIAVQLAFAFSAAISLTISFIVVKKSIPILRINILKVNREAIRELFRYTGHAAARSGSMIFMYSTVTLLLGKFGTTEQLDIYAIASLASGFVRSLLMGMQNVFLPVVTTLFANGQVEKMKTVVTKGTHISSVLTCITTIMLYLYASKLLALWIDNTSPETITVFRILIISEIARGFFGIWLPSLVGMGHLHALSTMSIITSAGAIIIELLLFNFSVYVPTAASIALLAATWVYMGIWLPVYGVYKTGLNAFNYIKNSLLGPLSAAAVSIVSLRLLNQIVPAGSINWFLMFIISGIIVSVIFFAISLRSEAREIIEVLRKKFGNTPSRCL